VFSEERLHKEKKGKKKKRRASRDCLSDPCWGGLLLALVHYYPKGDVGRKWGKEKKGEKGREANKSRRGYGQGSM